MRTGHSDDAHADRLVCVAGPGVSRCKLGALVERGERDECVADRTTRDSESGEETGKVRRQQNGAQSGSRAGGQHRRQTAARRQSCVRTEYVSQRA